MRIVKLIRHMNRGNVTDKTHRDLGGIARPVERDLQRSTGQNRGYRQDTPVFQPQRTEFCGQFMMKPTAMGVPPLLKPIPEPTK